MKKFLIDVVSIAFFLFFIILIIKTCIITEAGNFGDLPECFLKMFLCMTIIVLVAKYNERKEKKEEEKKIKELKIKQLNIAKQQKKAAEISAAEEKKKSDKRHEEIIESLYRSYVYDLCEKAMEPYRKQPPHD